MRFRFSLVGVLLCSVAFAAPPKLTIPAELKPTSGDYLTHKPDTDAVSVTYVGLSDLDPFPSAFLKDSRDFVLPTRGLKDGKYKFAAVAASATGEQTRADFVVVIGDGKPGPIIAPPPTTPTPDPKPPTTPTGSLYFLIVRTNGPADAAFTKTMGLEAWKELAKAGHLFKDKTLTEAASLGVQLPDGTSLPAVVILRESADKTKSAVVGGPLPLPTTNDGIRELPAKVVK